MSDNEDQNEKTVALLSHNGEKRESDRQETKSVPHQSVGTLKYRLLKSFIISNNFTFMGLSSALITPSIDELRGQVNCNYEQFARAYIFEKFGGMVGGLVGGVLADRFQKSIDLLIGLELILAALTRIAVPWVSNIMVMATLFCLTGFFLGTDNPASNAHTLAIWGEKASSPMQLVHMCFGLGTMLCPLIVAPFLTPTDASSDAYAYNGTSDWDNSTSGPDTTADSLIFVPFAIIGAYGIFAGVLHLLFHFVPSDMASAQRARVKERKTIKQLFSPGECVEGQALYSVTMIILMFFVFILNSGKDCSVNVYMYVVAVNSALEFTHLQGSLLATSYFACYAGGRAVYAVLGVWLPVQLLLMTEILGMLSVHSALALIGLDSQLNFFICICLSGFFAGPIVPTLMTWIDHYIDASSLVISILICGMNLGSFLFNWLSGYIFQHRQPVDLYYLSLGCALAMALIVAVAQCLGSCYGGDRYKKTKRSKDDAERDDACDL